MNLWYGNSRLNGLVLVAFILTVITIISNIAIEIYYLPLNVDGGRYSVPALSLSRGGDPSEINLSVEELKKIKGVKVSFASGDDFTGSIRIIPMSWWFRAFGGTIWTAKLFGILELFLLMTIMYLLLQQVSRERYILLLCWVVFLTDGEAISLGSRDLRADIMLTIMTLLILLFVCMEDKRKYRPLIFFGGVLSILCLVLTRITSAISLLLLISYLLTELYISRKTISNFKKYFYLSLVAIGVIGFVLRNQLLDLLIASKISFISTYQLEKYVYNQAKSVEILPVLEKELIRWTNYFLISNIGELLAILLGFGLFVMHTFSQSNRKSPPKIMSILVGCMFAIGGLVFLDPTRWPAHALPVVAVFILLLAIELKSISNDRKKNIFVSLMIAIVLISVGMKVAHGAKVAIMSIRNGYSNVAVTQTINQIFNSKAKTYMVIGGSELWPYFDQRKNVVIIDARTKWEIDRLANIGESVDFIILNNDYAKNDWERNYSSRYPDIRLRRIAEVGNPDSGWNFIKIIKPEYLR